MNCFPLNCNLALQRSANENIRGYATRAIAEANYDAQALSKSRSEAGVSYAPDGSMGPKTANLLQQLAALQGLQFDTAFASAQLSVMTDAEAQYGAYSQNGKSGPLRRFAQLALPKSKERLDLALEVLQAVRGASQQLLMTLTPDEWERRGTGVVGPGAAPSRTYGVIGRR
jgi:predicted outer membrane protein